MHVGMPRCTRSTLSVRSYTADQEIPYCYVCQIYDSCGHFTSSKPMSMRLIPQMTTVLTSPLPMTFSKHKMRVYLSLFP
jgi:hypothetical protein